MKIVKEFAQKKSFVAILFLPFICACLLRYGVGFQIFYNRTHSLPGTIYCLNPFQNTYKTGDLIAFYHNASKDIVIKRVIGREGDRIEHKPHGILINGTQLFLKDKRITGRPLTPLNVQVIPKGMDFVTGEHPDSFDSRYEEFGLISRSEVRGCVWPLC